MNCGHFDDFFNVDFNWHLKNCLNYLVLFSWLIQISNRLSLNFMIVDILGGLEGLVIIVGGWSNLLKDHRVIFFIMTDFCSFNSIDWWPFKIDYLLNNSLNSFFYNDFHWNFNKFFDNNLNYFFDLNKDLHGHLYYLSDNDFHYLFNDDLDWFFDNYFDWYFDNFLHWNFDIPFYEDLNWNFDSGLDLHRHLNNFSDDHFDWYLYCSFDLDWH